MAPSSLAVLLLPPPTVAPLPLATLPPPPAYRGKLAAGGVPVAPTDGGPPAAGAVAEAAAHGGVDGGGVVAPAANGPIAPADGVAPTGDASAADGGAHGYARGMVPAVAGEHVHRVAGERVLSREEPQSRRGGVDPDLDAAGGAGDELVVGGGGEVLADRVGPDEGALVVGLGLPAGGEAEILACRVFQTAGDGGVVPAGDVVIAPPTVATSPLAVLLRPPLTVV